MQIRPESPADASAIHILTEAAFKDAPHSSQTEAKIVAALRAAGALTVSLVAVVDGEIVGHVAFSPVTINGVADGWEGLGPVSVRPNVQGKGIGQALIREGLQQIAAAGAAGCIVLGDPAYYRRFGFEHDAELTYGDVPGGYFRRLLLHGAAPKGEVSYHPGFDAA